MWDCCFVEEEKVALMHNHWLTGLPCLEKETSQLHELTFVAMMRKEVGWFDEDQELCGCLVFSPLPDAV